MSTHTLKRKDLSGKVEEKRQVKKLPTLEMNVKALADTVKQACGGAPIACEILGLLCSLQVTTVKEKHSLEELKTGKYAGPLPNLMTEMLCNYGIGPMDHLCDSLKKGCVTDMEVLIKLALDLFEDDPPKIELFWINVLNCIDSVAQSKPEKEMPVFSAKITRLLCDKGKKFHGRHNRWCHLCY